MTASLLLEGVLEERVEVRKEVEKRSLRGRGRKTTLGSSKGEGTAVKIGIGFPPIKGRKKGSKKACLP